MENKVNNAVECCRQWYWAFRHMGRGNEKSVQGLLEAAALIEILAAQPKWFSVKEKLPENDANYLVFTSDNNAAEVATYYGDGEWLSLDSTNLTPLVTHWMPIPNVPEEDNNA